MPYFFSDLADWASLEYVGPAASWDARSSAARSTTASSASGTSTDGRVAGALSVGRSDDLEHARAADRRARAELGSEPSVLGDLDSDLAAL